MAVGPVEFLEAAHRRAEEIAQATTPVPVAGAWRVAQDKHDADDAPLALVQGEQEEGDPEYVGYGSNLPIIVHAAEWQDEAEANLRHIALHDPRSVLRRIAAERKILEAHPIDTDVINPGYGKHVADFGCRTCHDWDGVTEGYGWCDTVRLLAEGWGWTDGMT